MPELLPRIVADRLADAITLIGTVPGYRDQSDEIRALVVANKVRYLESLTDRAHAGLLGTITLGPEPFAPHATVLELAETLVHELYHLHQNPLLKTVSFWTGVATKSDVMVRYERPAYQAAYAFVLAFDRTFPDQANDVANELAAIRQTFESAYRQPLFMET